MHNHRAHDQGLGIAVRRRSVSGVHHHQLKIAVVGAVRIGKTNGSPWLHGEWKTDPVCAVSGYYAFLCDEPGYVARLRIFNPDGSEAELSGNGARQAILYLRRAGWTVLTGQAGSAMTVTMRNNTLANSHLQNVIGGGESAYEEGEEGEFVRIT